MKNLLYLKNDNGSKSKSKITFKNYQFELRRVKKASVLYAEGTILE